MRTSNAFYITVYQNSVYRRMHRFGLLWALELILVSVFCFLRSHQNMFTSHSNLPKHRVNSIDSQVEPVHSFLF